jgi:hypothetical protein
MILYLIEEHECKLLIFRFFPPISLSLRSLRGSWLRRRVHVAFARRGACKMPAVGRQAEAAAKRRAVVRCAKELATPTALAAYRTLLVDLARPPLTGKFEPPRLSQSELRMVDALMELLVRDYIRVFEC